MIEVNNLRKNYGALEVINDTTLRLPEKGLVAFLGESGSGKTTLLNVIGGLDSYKSGSISYDDIKFDKYKMDEIDSYRRNHFGYIFQNYNILEDKTVTENLLIALHIIGIYDKDECNKRIKNALEAVGLYKFRKKLAGALSGGQMQRVSIARALIKHNDVIIADEPTGNLDSESTIQIIHILKKLSLSSLIILVTHDIELANTYADYIYHIKDGVLDEYKEVNNNDILENEVLYSDESYDTSKETKFNLNLIKEEICLFFKGSLKNKIFKIIFFLIGFIFLFLNIIFCINDSKKIYDIPALEEVYTINPSNSTNKMSLSHDIADAIDKGYIDNLYAKPEKNDLYLVIGISVYFKLDIANFYNSSLIKSIILGEIPKSSDEMVISKKIADDLIKTGYYKSYDEIINLTPGGYKIVGISDDEQAFVFAPNKPAKYFHDISYNYYDNSYRLNSYNETLEIEGSTPKKLTDIIVSTQFLINRKLKVGQQLPNGDTICASFESNSESFYALDERVFIEAIKKEEIECTVSNLKKISGYLSFKTINKYNTLYLNNLDEYNQLKYLYITFEIGLSIICGVYIFFSMKARMLEDIYEIGVRRELGQSRRNVALKYLLKNFIMVTFTIVLGYIISSAIYSIIANIINSAGGNFPNILVEVSTYLSIITIYVMSLIFGIIPILLLLRKTPAQIVRKYDI